jgi:hypothetical protein
MPNEVRLGRFNITCHQGEHFFIISASTVSSVKRQYNASLEIAGVAALTTITHDFGSSSAWFAFFCDYRCRLTKLKVFKHAQLSSF